MSKLKQCSCCNGYFYLNEIKRYGLAYYCQYCLDSGLVACVVQNDTEMVVNADMTELHGKNLRGEQ